MEPNIAPFPPTLRREEFALALKHGRGAAVRHVLAHGLAGVADLVLAACLENQAYDSQCEGNRARWLYPMFKDAPEYARFAARILAALREADDEKYSLAQLCELASLMACDGNAYARQTLQDFYWQQDFDHSDVDGSAALIACDGLPAVIGIARRYGEILLTEPDATVETLYYLLGDQSQFATIFAQLQSAAIGDAALIAYVACEQQAQIERLADEQEQACPAQQAARKERFRADVMAKLPIAELYAQAERKTNAKSLFYRFGKFADAASLEVVLQRFVEEQDVEVCLRLLWVFHNGILPSLPFKIWAFAQHSDVRMRQAAFSAMVHVKQPEVGEFARQRIALDELTVENAALIELFVHHFRAGDEILLLAALQKIALQEDDAHVLGDSIRHLYEKNAVADLAGLALWLYRTNPCTICRESALRFLQEVGKLPAEIALEARYDASKDTRDMFAADASEKRVGKIEKEK